MLHTIERLDAADFGEWAEPDTRDTPMLTTLTRRDIIKITKQEKGSAMITIENIRDLNNYLGARFSDEPTVRVHIVTDERPGDTVAVEVTPDDNAYVVFFGLDRGTAGVDALIAYTYGLEDEDSEFPWAPVGPGVCEGALMSDAPDSFDTREFNDYMRGIFGALYSDAVTD